MKNFMTTFISLTLLSFFLIGCGGGPSIKTNEYLGELPSLEKYYYEKTQEQEKKIKDNTDMNSALKLGKELEDIKNERKTKIEEYAATNPFKPLPFESIKREEYTIKDVVVNRATYGTLNIKFNIKINKTIANQFGTTEKWLFVYYKAVDSKGVEISNSKTVATNAGRIELVEGIDYEAFGTWQSKATIGMEDFAKIVEITKEEYDAK